LRRPKRSAIKERSAPGRRRSSSSSSVVVVVVVVVIEVVEVVVMVVVVFPVHYCTYIENVTANTVRQNHVPS